MAKSFPVLKLAALLFMSMVVTFHHSEAMMCGELNPNLTPCGPYLNGIDEVPSGCCNGLKAILDEANDKPERQQFCSCEKEFFATLTDEQLQKAAAIPGLCGVTLPFQVSRTVDCSKVI